MRVISMIIVFLVAFTWEWLNYNELYSGELLRTITLAVASLVVPVLILGMWYLALFVLGYVGTNLKSFKLRIIEIIWIIIFIFRLRYPIIDGHHVPARDNAFSLFMFALLIVLRPWVTSSVNSLFERYKINILTEFGVDQNSRYASDSFQWRIALFLLGGVILAFVF